MITLVDIRKLVDRLTKKEQRGNIISGEDFNTFIRIANSEHFDSEKRKADVTSDIVDSLRSFLSTYTGSATNGTVVISSSLTNYGKLLSAQRIYTGSDYVRCDIVTQLEKEERLSNSLTVATDRYPIASVEGLNINFLPAATKNVKIVYYKKPADPYLDWYWDVDDNINYMDVTPTGDHTLTSGQTYSDGTTNLVTKTSKTVELEWADNSDRIAIAYRVLLKVGVTIPNNLAVELGASEVMKSDNKS